MAKKALIKLTRIQSEILEMYRNGMSESQIVAARTGETCTHHSHKVALRKKGAISRGQQGVKGSVKVLIDNYVIIDRKSPPSPPKGWWSGCNRNRFADPTTITPLTSVSA